MKLQPMAHGAHTGWCSTCGGDCFNGLHHRCPKKIPAKTLAVVIAAKLYRDARIDLRASTNGTLQQVRAQKAEAERFDDLRDALSALDADTTFPSTKEDMTP